MKLLLLLFFTITPFLILCQTTEKEKEEIIKKYVINDQMFKMSEMFYENQLSTVKDSHSELPDSVWEEVRIKVNDQETFVNEFVKLYMSLFTIDELREIRDSLEKPAMKKLSEMSQGDKYMNEFGMVGVRCGRQISENIVKYLRNEGYIE